MTDKIIRGSGGPPPTPPSPTRAPDTLNSRQFATIQDLLSEGEIEGFATASKAELTKGTTDPTAIISIVETKIENITIKKN